MTGLASGANLLRRTEGVATRAVTAGRPLGRAWAWAWPWRWRRWRWRWRWPWRWAAVIQLFALPRERGTLDPNVSHREATILRAWWFSFHA